MKLFDIFKKKASKEAKHSMQNMDKKQLSKVIGGAETLAHEVAHVKQEITKQ
ncbi:MAG TPA: hypothetical protein PKZ75_14380 [Bacteroidia bacterium]|nr:hypothetical protein [Bacteroidia bacterium]